MKTVSWIKDMRGGGLLRIGEESIHLSSSQREELMANMANVVVGVESAKSDWDVASMCMEVDSNLVRMGGVDEPVAILIGKHKGRMKKLLTGLASIVDFMRDTVEFGRAYQEWVKLNSDTPGQVSDVRMKDRFGREVVEMHSLGRYVLKAAGIPHKLK